MPSTPKFKVGKLVRLICNSDIGTVSLIDTSDILPYLVRFNDGHSIWLDEAEIEAVEDDPPTGANYIVLPRNLVRRMMTKDEAEDLIKDIRVPACILHVVQCVKPQLSKRTMP